MIKLWASLNQGYELLSLAKGDTALFLAGKEDILDFYWALNVLMHRKDLAGLRTDGLNVRLAKSDGEYTVHIATDRVETCINGPLDELTDAYTEIRTALQEAGWINE